MFEKSEIKIEYKRGSGPGGQKKNKTASACRITHLATGVSGYADERSQSHSRKAAMQALTDKLAAKANGENAATKKADRDRKIREAVRVRTYHQCDGYALDHATRIRKKFSDVVANGDIQEFLRARLRDVQVDNED